MTTKHVDQLKSVTAPRPSARQLQRLRVLAARRDLTEHYERVLDDHKHIDRDLSGRLVEAWIADLDRTW